MVSTAHMKKKQAKYTRARILLLAVEPSSWFIGNNSTAVSKNNSTATDQTNDPAIVKPAWINV
jgi:hypothetical protein